MDNLIDWENIQEKSLHEQLNEKIEYNKEKDKLKLIDDLDEEDLEEELYYHQKEYSLFKEKLDFINMLNKDDSEKRKRHYQILIKLDHLEDVSEKRRFKMMLSYGVLSDYFTKLHERTDEEIIMLSASSSSLELDRYTEYMGILSDKTVANAIVAKSNVLDHQLDMAYDIMEAQDKYSFAYLTPDNFDTLVKSALEVVNNYKINHK
jgi:hypothetical protein